MKALKTFFFLHIIIIINNAQKQKTKNYKRADYMMR
mgnify:FL=1